MTTTYRDYYQILGVPKSADVKEIKRAYRKLARRWHPDVNPGDTAAAERFREATEAYEVLSDTERRRRYDRHGPDREGVAAGAVGGHRAPSAWGGHRTVAPDDPREAFDAESPFSDFFRSVFGEAGLAEAIATGRRRA